MTIVNDNMHLGKFSLVKNFTKTKSILDIVADLPGLGLQRRLQLQRHTWHVTTYYSVEFIRDWEIQHKWLQYSIHLQIIHQKLSPEFTLPEMYVSGLIHNITYTRRKALHI